MVLFYILTAIFIALTALIYTKVFLPYEYKKLENDELKNIYHKDLTIFSGLIALGFLFLALSESFSSVWHTVFVVLGFVSFGLSLALFIFTYYIIHKKRMEIYHVNNKE
jgi:tellurite resistance protein TehA-like permease